MILSHVRVQSAGRRVPARLKFCYFVRCNNTGRANINRISIITGVCVSKLTHIFREMQITAWICKAAEFFWRCLELSSSTDNNGLTSSLIRGATTKNVVENCFLSLVSPTHMHAHHRHMHLHLCDPSDQDYNLEFTAGLMWQWKSKWSVLQMFAFFPPTQWRENWVYLSAELRMKNEK